MEANVFKRQAEGAAGGDHVVWGRPELSSSSDSGSESPQGSMSRGSHRTFHHHLEVDSSASVAPSESSESQSGAGSPFKSRIAPKAEVDVFYKKMKELSKAVQKAPDARAWNPNEPLEDLKQRLLQDLQDISETFEEEEEEEGEPQEGMWSVGSEGHAEGQCRPCHYVFAKTGCQNGTSCNFCHLQHQRRFRPRPCKSKRFKCKQLASALDQVMDEDPSTFHSLAQQLSAQGGYLGTVVKSKLRSMAKRAAKSEASSSEAARGAGRHRLSL